MLIIAQYLVEFFHSDLPGLQKAKPITLHATLLIFILLYAFVGGLIFMELEGSALEKQYNDRVARRFLCAAKTLEQWNDTPNNTTNALIKCWEEDDVDIISWNYMSSTLFGFGIVTTLGYNRIGPITKLGRIFCIIYGICGIPITMIIIANIGQYLSHFIQNYRRKLEDYEMKKRQTKEGYPLSISSSGLVVIGLLCVFFAYVVLGALLLPLLNGEFDFLNGLYHNFLCLTAIDFGQLVPQRVAFLPITFIYVCIGLAITTIAIDIGAEYMRKLHYVGKKMHGVAKTRIWFGSKRLNVKDLLQAVGEKCGVDESFINNLNLENVVERKIAINEGKEPPPDMNTELNCMDISPKEASRGEQDRVSLLQKTIDMNCPIVCSSSIRSNSNFSFTIPYIDTSYAVETISSPKQEHHLTIFIPEPYSNVDSYHSTVPMELIDVNENTVEEDDVGENYAHAVDHANVLEHFLPKQSGDDFDVEASKVSRTFKAKKEKNVHNPEKLLKIYHEEWQRFNRLAGGRRNTTQYTDIPYDDCKSMSSSPDGSSSGWRKS